MTSKSNPNFDVDGPNRVPRPLDKWFFQMWLSSLWEHQDLKVDWFPNIVELAKEYGCELVVDPLHHWKESVYISDKASISDGRKATILAGAKGNPNYVCTVILHEIGHRIVDLNNQIPKHDYLLREEEAWKEAQILASRNQLPCISEIKRQGLYSYRYRKQMEEYPGSKRKTKKPKKKNIDRLLSSKRTVSSSTSDHERPLGKKGKRKVKKELKKRTHKSERRKKPRIDD